MSRFKDVTKKDVMTGIRNNERPIKRKTCCSNGTRYTINVVRYESNLTNVIKDILDHRKR
jgi:hypothetical protein